MGVYKHIIKPTLILVFLLLTFLVFSFLFNKYQIKPAENEIIELKNFYKSKINIKNTDNIILLQNYTIDNISHNSNGINEIDIINILKTKKGLCFHRSLIMQKVMLLNGIKIRPIFLFSNPFQKSTSIVDFFSTKVYTHNIFEYYWNGKWYVMETNNKMLKPLSLNEFLSKQKIFRIQPRFVRYLNNRNGRFIKPSWIPDIY
jgi:hypothetical protein